MSTRREIIDRYVDKVVLYKDRIDVRFNFIADFSISESYGRGKSAI